LNQLFLIAGTFARRAAALNKQYEADVAQIGLETMLDPSRLVAGAGIEESRQKVQRFEALLDQYLKACSDMNDNYHREVSAIQETAPNRDAIVAQFEQGIARTYDFNIRLGENQRTLIDLFRRVLTLAESRLGRIALRDGKLVFADDADLATYRALVEQIVAETKREDELNKEQAARRQRAVEALRKL
jgi:hypothetical protein